MLFKPKWLNLVQEGCQPSSDDKIKQLEALRKKFNIPHDMFALRITSSLESIRPLQRHLLNRLKAQKPKASERDLWREILEARIAILENLGSQVPDEDEINALMKRARTFDDICDFIVSLYSVDDEGPDPLGIGKEVDRILREGRPDDDDPLTKLNAHVANYTLDVAGKGLVLLLHLSKPLAKKFSFKPNKDIPAAERERIWNGPAKHFRDYYKDLFSDKRFQQMWWAMILYYLVMAFGLYHARGLSDEDMNDLIEFVMSASGMTEEYYLQHYGWYDPKILHVSNPLQTLSTQLAEPIYGKNLEKIITEIAIPLTALLRDLDPPHRQIVERQLDSFG